MEEIKTIENYIFDDTINLEMLVNDYSNFIYKIVKNMTNNLFKNEDIEEIISDVLFAIWKNQTNINPKLPLKPYVSGITKNLIKNKLRNKKNNNIIYFDDDSFEIKDEINLEELVQSNEKMKIIEQTLDRLGKENKKIFKMFYYNGMKAKDISKQLNLSEFNINTKLHRIRKKIKTNLEKRGYNYGK